MQHSEKRTNPRRHVSPAAVKDRLFDRYFNEHAFLKDLVSNHFPDYRSTHLENSGIASRIAKLDADDGIFELADDVATSLTYLARLYENSEVKVMYPHFTDCIKAQVSVLRLLDWLYAFGPSKQ